MSYLTKFKIRDTGKRRAGDTSATEEKAPGDDGVAGSWLTLDVEEISFDLSSQMDDTPELSQFEADDSSEIYGLSEVNKSGIGIPTWTLRGVIDFGKISGRKKFAALLKHVKTKGVKNLAGVDGTLSFINYINYYDDYYANVSKTAGTAPVNNEQLESNALIDFINVRIKEFTINPVATTNFVRWTLVLLETD